MKINSIWSKIAVVTVHFKGSTVNINKKLNNNNNNNNVVVWLKGCVSES